MSLIKISSMIAGIYFALVASPDYEACLFHDINIHPILTQRVYQVLKIVIKLQITASI